MWRFIWTMSLLVPLLVSCGVSDVAQQKYIQSNESWQAGEKEIAIQSLREAIKIEPEFVQAHLRLANYLNEMGRYSDAVVPAKRALQLNRNPGNLLLVGDIYRKQGLFQDAQPYYSDILSMTKENPEISQEYVFFANLGKGICKIEQNFTEDARGYIEKAKQHDKTNKELIFYSALLREAEIGPNLKSKEIYENTLKSLSKAEISKKQRILKQLGNFWHQLGYENKAIFYYQDFIKSGGQDAKITQRIQVHEEQQTRQQLAAKAKQNEIAMRIRLLEEERKLLDAKRLADAQSQEQKRKLEQERQRLQQEQQEQQKIVQRKQQLEKIFGCQECGRIGRKGQTTCDFDGTTLVLQEKLNR